ncbi:S8 family peptidase [Fusibacter paucivorans]|uniref:S8 family peptidase n=1 Tax=Fusibacter paucivorans TaxID=76009 RepID=A0ABS5PUJ0_9FIRM|nr:S8 family peptidase [Fusibacter paucivorans]MBS7528833.1 S8 family peptidase [Fusibacter paucivorans]
MAVEKKNIFLVDTNTSIPYVSRSMVVGKNFPKRENGRSHASYIAKKLELCYEKSITQKQAAAIRYKEGVYIEFSSSVEYDLAIKSLENRTQGIRLLNVKSDEKEKIVRATVYIPAGKEQYFLSKAEEYLTKTTKKGLPKNNDLISSIEDVRLALLESFWMGKHENIPDIIEEWCEVWIRFEPGYTEQAIDNLKSCCSSLDIQIDNNNLEFPERLVFLIKANKNQLSNLVSCCDYITEFRKASEPTSFFDDLAGIEQEEWIKDLLNRTEFIESNARICLLDTGVSSTHPLIKPVIDENSMNCVNEQWGIHDNYGHGTKMAGIALYNNLKDTLSTTDTVAITHKLESVKILPPKGSNLFELYGAITEQAVALAEIANPNVDRVICMAITAQSFNTDDGSPTSWSASLDNITSGANENSEKRLMFVSAGNVSPFEISDNKYPDINILHSIENPGQSWNAITVGALVNELQVTSNEYEKFSPVADIGQLSPYSSTSVTWNDKWPIKPEIVLDGGNMITNGVDYSECTDLSLLTTNHQHLIRPFSTIWGTSSATAIASWMATQIYTEYPGIWPETVRALLVHSSRWTKNMKEQFCKEDTKTKGRKLLLRSCGYGVPDLNKAIQCAGNSVNLIVEGELQPFKKDHMNEMHLHKLPWPREVLQSLGEIEASLRVTLSYFIEPGPGEVGWKDKYRYPSCGLRFDVINSNETLEDFEKRVNVKMRGEDKKDSGDGSSRDWYLGVGNRDVGSIHSDFCNDLAVNLCDANYVAIYPVIGWWRERGYLGKYNEKVRYSLIISIETPETSVDLYSPIITQISTSTVVETTINV